MRNVVMLMVTVSTVHQTVFIIFMAYLSKGWLLTTHGQNAFGFINIEGNESAMLSAMVGGIYVMYSSLYLTVDSYWGQIFINLFLKMLILFLKLLNITKFQ